MAGNVVTIPVWPNSDGTNDTDKGNGRVRNDAHYQERLAQLWMKDQNLLQPGVIYKLDQMPTGYSGWEKRRGTSTHVDRYLVGHPSGKDFRSINEAWPHFHHLILHGGPVGCPCILCTGGRKPRSAPATKTAKATAPTFPRSRKTQKTFDSDSHAPKRSQQIDSEGIPDYYRLLLDVVKAAGPGGTVCENVVDHLSPDWKVGHQLLHGALDEWQQQAAFTPRLGEIVLFTRTLAAEDKLGWDANTSTLRPYSSAGWRDAPRWEAGVVTQLPTEPVSEEDLQEIPTSKTRSIVYSGFRVEPLSEPGNQAKPFTSQHKYVPLHALRPFSFYKECLAGTAHEQWHPTIRHALTVSSSWSLLGKYSFAGSWPEATLFCRGMYLGPELVIMGDVVCLEPKKSDARPDTIVDVMVVSSIRLRFVKLEEASDDDYDDGYPYTTCLHVAGRAYTLDPKHSYGGIAASPARPDQGDFPSVLREYGNWFHITDPQNERQRLELPYTRVLGRCIGKPSLQKWFATPPHSGAQHAVKNKAVDISRGLCAMREAKAYSREQDARIDKSNGQSWLWAESRIEQLDLYEINGRFVGKKDHTRDKKQVTSWRQALKVLDGKKGALDEYLTARKQREEEQKSGVAHSSGWGMMSSAAQGQSAEDDEAGEGGNAMDVDEIAESPMQELLLDDHVNNGGGETGEDEVMMVDGGSSLDEVEGGRPIAGCRDQIQ